MRSWRVLALICELTVSISFRILQNERIDGTALISQCRVAKRVDSPMEEAGGHVEKVDTSVKRHDSPLEEDDIANEKAAKKC